MAAAAGALLAGWSTSRYGVGVSPDSASYIGAARSLARGGGLAFNGLPFAHWPPLYPMLLALFGRLRVDPIQAARLCGVALAGVNAALAALLAFRLSGRSASAGAAAGLLIAAAPEITRIHAMAWSEPPFLALTLAGLCILTTHCVRGTEAQRGTDGSGVAGETEGAGARRSAVQLGMVVGLGAIVGAAALTRYAGAALIPPFALCIWRFGAGTSRQRMAGLVLFAGVALLPLVCWLVYLQAGAHVPSDRPLAFHPPHGPAWLLLPAAVYMALAASRRLRHAADSALEKPSTSPHHPVAPSPHHARQAKGTDRAILALWLYAFLAVYFGFVLFSMTFVDAFIPFDGRNMAPAIVCGMLALVRPLCGAFGRLSGVRAAGLTGKGLAAAALGLLVGRAAQGIQLAERFHETGNGYSGRAWAHSRGLAWIAAAPPVARILSNAPEVIAYRFGRRAVPFPAKFSTTSLARNPRLDADVAAFREAMRGGAIAIYFRRDPRSYLLSPADLEGRCGLAPVLDLGDAVVYAPAPQ